MSNLHLLLKPKQLCKRAARGLNEGGDQLEKWDSHTIAVYTSDEMDKSKISRMCMTGSSIDRIEHIAEPHK